MEPSSKRISFGRWFFTGGGGTPGWKLVISWHLLIHSAVALLAGKFITMTPDKLATTVILPLTAIFVAVGFAWSINAYSMLSSPEMRRLAKVTPGGLHRLVSPYQVVVTILLVNAAIWGMIAAGPYPVDEKQAADLGNLWTLRLIGFTTSMVFVETWAVANSARELLFDRAEVEEIEDSRDSRHRDDALAKTAYDAGVDAGIAATIAGSAQFGVAMKNPKAEPSDTSEPLVINRSPD